MSWRAGATAVTAIVLLHGCGGEPARPAPHTGAASTAAAVTTAPSQPAGGDTAMWGLDPELVDAGFPPADGSDPISAAATSFVAYVTRLGCAAGVTGEVLAPSITTTDTDVIVTFAVEPLADDVVYTCPANDVVAAEVELGQAIGERRLVDGACRSGDAAGTTFCVDGGVRWQPAPSSP